MSRERIVFRRPPTNVVVALEDPQPRRDHSFHFDLKELQRRAYERGLAKERETSTKLVESLTKAVRQHLDAAAKERQADRAHLEEFAVRLALWVGEKLVLSSLEEKRHDAAAMIRQAITEVERDGITGSISVRLHPDDVEIVKGSAVAGGDGTVELDLVADRGIARGSFVIQSGETAYWSVMAERMEAMRARLLETMRPVNA